jgi:hypothetical protein
VLVNASISQFCANGRWEIFRFLSFVYLLRWIGYICVPMACSVSPKSIGIIRIHTIRIRYGTVGIIGVS